VNDSLYFSADDGVHGRELWALPPGPPTVSSLQINDGSAQRSRVTSLTVTFNSVVSFAGPVASAFTLMRTGGGSVNFSATANVIGGVTVVTINSFSGTETDFGSLADGRYTLTALGSQINANGQPLDGNGDGTGGDDYVLASAPSPNPPTGIFRFFGDLDGDGDVDAANFLGFRSVFVGIVPYDPALDFDGSGSVDAGDFLQLRNRFLLGSI